MESWGLDIFCGLPEAFVGTIILPIILISEFTPISFLHQGSPRQRICCALEHVLVSLRMGSSEEIHPDNGALEVIRETPSGFRGIGAKGVRR